MTLRIVGIGIAVVGVAVLVWLAVSLLGGKSSAQVTPGDDGPTGARQSSNAGRAPAPTDQEKKEVKAET